MLGAALLLSALAISGGGDDVQVSTTAPHAGRPYAAVFLPGPGTIDCAGRVGKTRVRVSYRRVDAGTTCLLQIPRRTAGKVLVFSYGAAQQSEPEPVYVNGVLHHWTSRTLYVDGGPIHRVIRR